MDGQWTYSDLETEWVHDSYNTKEEAIEEAKKTYDLGCFVGQLEHQHGVNYKVINQEKVMF